MEHKKLHNLSLCLFQATMALASIVAIVTQSDSIADFENSERKAPLGDSNVSNMLTSKLSKASTLLKDSTTTCTIRNASQMLKFFNSSTLELIKNVANATTFKGFDSLQKVLIFMENSLLFELQSEFSNVAILTL